MGIVGWVAEYCVICRDVHAHSMKHVTDGESSQQVPTVTCNGCGLVSQTVAERYHAIVPVPPTETEALVRTTFPNLPLAQGGRVLFDKAAIAGDLPVSARADAVREPFELVSYLGKRKQGWLPTIMACLVLSFFTFIAGIGVMTKLTRKGVLQDAPSGAATPTQVAIVVTPPLLTVVGLVGWQVHRNRKLRDHRVLSMLARSLRPIRPTDEELDAVAHWMKAARSPLHGMFDIEELRVRIRKEPDRSFSNMDADAIIRDAQAMSRELELSRARQLPDAPLDHTDDFHSGEAA
jgi:hypothetical protein